MVVKSMAKKELSILTDVRAACKECGHMHVYDGLYKRQRLGRLQTEGFTEACDKCGGELVLVKLLPRQVTSRPDLDVMKYLGRVMIEVIP